jgi:hypothetical protein
MAAVRPAPWLIAAALALAWLTFAPPTPDLAAQVYRAWLFQSHGFTLFNANWYGGHHTPAYSILFPPLGALLGVRVVGVLAARGSPGLADGVGRVIKVSPQSVDLVTRRPGFTLVRVRFTPYWRIARGRGCVMRGAGGWTLVDALSSGPLRIDAAFDPRRLTTRSARCTGAHKSVGTHL